MLSLLTAILLTQGMTSPGFRSPRPAIGTSQGGSEIFSREFLTPGCYASGTAGISITRATTAWYENPPGTVNSCASGSYRVEAEGLLVEHGRTNYVLNSGTHPKTSEATSALSTGAHSAWHRGTGTLTVAAGTATVSGLSCSAVSAGTVCSFSVSVGGTVLVTTTSGTTHAQVENGTTRSSDIQTAGAAVTRNAESVSTTIPALSSIAMCIEGSWQTYKNQAWNITPTYRGLVGFGTYTTANSLSVSVPGASYISVPVYDNTPAVRSATTTTNPTSFTQPTVLKISIPSTGVNDVTGSYNSGTAFGWNAEAGAGTGLWTTVPTTLRIGNFATGFEFGGWVKYLKIYRSPACR